MDYQQLETPCFLVDLEIVANNCSVMRKRFSDRGIKLRPHVKTHKTLQIAKLQTDGSKECIVVSTLKEAEFFRDGGFDDILLGALIVPNKLDRLKRLAHSLNKFHVFIDDFYALQLLEDNPLSDGKLWSIYILIDNGSGRDGCFWSNEQNIINLAQYINDSKSMILHGLYIHEGNSYYAQNTEELSMFYNETVKMIHHIQEILLKKGINCPNTSIGATPSCSKLGSNSQISEAHPGNYVFYDAQNMQLNSCKKEDVAVRVMTRVIGHNKHTDTILIDCGFLGLSHDGKGMLPHRSYCYIEDNPHLSLVKMTQEVGMIDANEGKEMNFDYYPLGSILFLIPYHSCATAAMYPHYYIKTSGDELDKWEPCRGW